ncbi:MAG: dTDP-4-dehydrorhamnose 3,5-epimerase [Bacteroidetes bacterium]|nr:dTDP-4-dehydrorhamnose 3,5-epimerase [Bacteroidota bacterium]
MKFKPTAIEGCFIIEPQLISDDRGWFARVFCEEEALPFLGKIKLVQINHSFNIKKGTFRGMHYQVPPYAEGKLIRCIAGAVADFVLDIRKNSPTFLKWISVELSAKNHNLIFVPEGCAHGFQTLEDNTELIYHHTNAYRKDADRGIRFDDLMVKIKLPIEISVMSEKDKCYEMLASNFKGI